jgi:prevent-host-death family protein
LTTGITEIRIKCIEEGEFSMSDVWQAGVARHRFSELVDAAVDGRPQVIRRRDGHEVVVVSKEYYETTKPNLKSVLLSHHFGERGDIFDTVLEEARATLGTTLTPEYLSPENRDDDRSGHRRIK